MTCTYRSRLTRAVWERGKGQILSRDESGHFRGNEAGDVAIVRILIGGQENQDTSHREVRIIEVNEPPSRLDGSSGYLRNRQTQQAS